MRKLIWFLFFSTLALGQVAQVQHGGTGNSTTADNDILIATGPSTYSLVTLPSCADTGGNHLNYASHAVTCGTSSSTNIHGIAFTIYTGSALTSGTTIASVDYVTVPFACTIQAYNLVIDTGTITVKFWKVATGTAIPTSGNSINTSGVSIASGTAIHSTTLTDFTTTTVTANDILAMDITAVAGGANYVNGVLQCQ